MTVCVRDWQWEKWLENPRPSFPESIWIEPMVFGDLYADKAREKFEMTGRRPMVHGDLYA